MHRLFKLTLLSFLFSSAIVNQSIAQIEQGTICIDPYIGVPGEKMLLKINFPDPDWTYTGWPVSIGTRFEYLIMNYVGIGFDINYSTYGFEYTDEDAYYNSVTGNFEDQIIDNNYSCFRFMARANYHLIRTERLNAYVGGGLGGRKINSDCYINGVSDNSANITDALPLSYRIAIGGRFHFTENIGISGELGLYGGGIAQFGVSIKF